MDKFEFTPKTGFNDSTAYPDPSSESETREQLMRPHTQIAEYVNTTLKPAIEAIEGASGDEEAIKRIETAMSNVEKGIFTIDGVTFQFIITEE